MKNSSKHTIIKNLRFIGFTATLIASTSAFGSQTAHVHGEGHVNIAIEDDRVYLELESPGADIVGFEYGAKSAEETAAVAKAVARLEDPMQIMRFNADAGCRVISATAGVEQEDVEHDEHKEHEEHEEHNNSSEHSEAHDEHAAYRGEYEIQCADISALESIEFTYFEHFPNAQTLDIVLVRDNGQQQQDVDRSNPVLMLNR